MDFINEWPHIVFFLKLFFYNYFKNINQIQKMWREITLAQPLKNTYERTQF